MAPYFQDDVQIKPRLKVNWGVRWDLAFPFTSDFKTNQLTFFDPKAVNAAEINPLTGKPLLGAMAELGTCSACSGWSQQDMNWHHLSPRVGFTYQLNNKTVVLGGVSWYWLDTGSFEYGVNKVAVNYGNNLNGVVSIGQPAPQIPGFGQWDTRPLPALPSLGFSPGFFNGTSILGFGQVHELPRQVNQAYDEQFVIGVQRETAPEHVPFRLPECTRMTSTCRLLSQSGSSARFRTASITSVCPQSPSSAPYHHYRLRPRQPWTLSAPRRLWPVPGTFGLVADAPGTCGGNAAPVTYYAPYNNFCQEQSPGRRCLPHFTFPADASPIRTCRLSPTILTLQGSG